MPRVHALLARVPPAPDEPNELLGLRLLSLHNLRFLLDLTAGARRAIEDGRLADFSVEMRRRMRRAKHDAAALIFILVLLVLFLVWLLLVRPQRRRQRNQQTMIDSLESGDEIADRRRVLRDGDRGSTRTR